MNNKLDTVRHADDVASAKPLALSDLYGSTITGWFVVNVWSTLVPVAKSAALLKPVTSISRLVC